MRGPEQPLSSLMRQASSAAGDLIFLIWVRLKYDMSKSCRTPALKVWSLRPQG